MLAERPGVRSVLFDHVIEACRLHPAVAPFTIRRLLMRAGVREPESIGREELRAAIPTLITGLERFLGEEDLRAAAAAFSALAK